MSVCLLWTMRVLAAVAGLALAGCGGQKSPEVATAQAEATRRERRHCVRQCIGAHIRRQRLRQGAAVTPGA